MKKSRQNINKETRNINIYMRIFVLCFVILTPFIFTYKAHAMTPTLSISQSGNDNVSLTVNGDSNSNVTLYYNLSYGTQSRTLGNTNYNGFFSTIINTSNYGITPGQSAYVTVNGQQSSSYQWPYAYSNSNSLSLSQTNLSLTIGQTVNVNAYNNYNYGNLYISSNSNPNVATTSVSGSNIYIYAVSNGSTNINVCQSGGNSCGTIYINVGGSNYYNNNNLGLNISNLNFSIGNSITISSINSSNIYLRDNSNPSVASSSYSSLPPGCAYNANYSVTTGQRCYQQNNNNQSITITALSAGSDVVTVCQSYNSNNCNTINIVVTGYNQTNYQNYPTYQNYTSTSPSCYFSKTLSFGMSGSDVYCLQTYLYTKGYLTNSNDLNSYFDQDTQNAVMALQRDNYLYADGIVGWSTRSKLF